MRACPRCAVELAPATAPLALAGILGPVNGGVVDTDACPSCGGTFLDAEEFGLVTGNVGLESFLREATGALHAHASGSGEALACPGCGDEMDATGAAGIAVDACGSCGGLWFDRDEIERLRDARAPGA